MYNLHNIVSISTPRTLEAGTVWFKQNDYVQLNKGLNMY